MISTIYEYLYNTTSGEICYSIFEKILETVPENRKRIQDMDIDMMTGIVQSVKRFCDNNIIREDILDDEGLIVYYKKEK